jgi:hypothetical protein
MRSKFFVVAILLTGITACQQKSAENQPDPALKIRGGEITAAAGKTLVSTVQQQMAEGGVQQAINFCQLNALPITDSLSQIQGVSIKRTALKLRSYKNAPDSLERAVLNNYVTSKNFEPQLMASKTGAVYFEPIMLKGFCQTCHGTPGESMTLETDSIIKSIYHADAATGFAEGDFRGMWAIYFNN